MRTHDTCQTYTNIKREIGKLQGKMGEQPAHRIQCENFITIQSTQTNIIKPKCTISKASFNETIDILDLEI